MSLVKACVSQAAIGSTTIIPRFPLMRMSSIVNTGGASSITLYELSDVDNIHTPHNVCVTHVGSELEAVMVACCALQLGLGPWLCIAVGWETLGVLSCCHVTGF